MKKKELYEMILALQQRVADLETTTRMQQPIGQVRPQFRPVLLPKQDTWLGVQEAYADRAATPEEARQAASQVRHATEYPPRFRIVPAEPSPWEDNPA